MPYKDKEKQKEYQQKYHKRLKYKWYKYQQWDAQLGTTTFKSKICRKKNGYPDFKQELKEIQKEKQKILHSKYKQYGNRRKYLRHNFLSTEET